MPLTPTPGTDALAAGIPLVPGTGLSADLDEYINRLADVVAQRSQVPGSPLPVAKGGTGSNSAATARTNLGVVESAGPNAATPGKCPVYNSFGRLVVEDPSTPFETVNIRFMNASIVASINAAAFLPTSGGTVSGSLLLPNASAAVSGYTVAYINGDGRVSRGASSERYKKYISQIDPASIGNLFPGLWRFQMRTGDGSWKYGDIAERLAENEATQPFVVYNEQGVPESVDFIGLLNARVAQLDQRVHEQDVQLELLAQRLEELEARHAEG